MKAVASSGFLKEFTFIADKAHDEGEIFFVQRSNDKNGIYLSMEKWNELQKELFLLKNKNAK